MFSIPSSTSSKDPRVPTKVLTAGRERLTQRTWRHHPLVGLPGGGAGNYLGEGHHWPEVVPCGARRPRFSRTTTRGCGKGGAWGWAGPAGGPRGGRTCPCRSPADPACPGGAAMKLKLKNVFLAYFLVSIAGLLYALVQLGERGGAGCGGPALGAGDEPPRRLLPARSSGQLLVAPCLELRGLQLHECQPGQE